MYLVSEQYSSGGDDKLSIVDAAGKEHAAAPVGPLDNCFDDQRSVLVCASDDQGSWEPTDEIVAFDTDSGKKLWGYGEKSENRGRPEDPRRLPRPDLRRDRERPVVMNARTGEDEPNKLEHLPWAVSKYAAAAVTEGSFTDPNGDTEKQNAITYLRTAG